MTVPSVALYGDDATPGGGVHADLRDGGFTVNVYLGGAPATTPSATDEGVNAAVTRAAPARPLYICARDQASRRAFMREHGEVRYVTADEVLASSRANETWAAPRCITRIELDRLQRMTERVVYASR